jgi:predicted P-loop ATPase
MGSRGATVKKNGELIYSDGGQSQTPRQALDMILLDYNTARTSLLTKQADMPKEERRRIPKHDTRLLTAALNEYVEKQRGQFLVKLREKLQHTPDSSPSELKKFVKAIRGKEDPVAEAVLEHFIWQVKRKIFGHDVQYHLMPILTGIQGNGKSTAVKKLYAPLLDFVATPTLTELTDKRFFESHKYNFIAFCDEMQNADKTDVEALKNFITADRQTARELYSTTMVEFKQNCTAIGCSNKSLATLIYDPTGMRRFFEISTDPEMKANGGWALLGEVDFEKLWQQVDENIPAEHCPYLGKAEEIKAAQELLRTPDPVEAFLEFCEATVTDPTKTTLVKKTDFYSSYRLFCNRNGHKHMNSTWLGRAMSEKGFQEGRPTMDGKPTRCWEVSASYHAPLE